MNSNFLEISKAKVKVNYEYIFTQAIVRSDYELFPHCLNHCFCFQSNNNCTRTRTALALKQLVICKVPSHCSYHINEVSKKYNIRLENVVEWKNKVEENGNTQAKSCRCFLNACSAS